MELPVDVATHLQWMYKFAGRVELTYNLLVL
jgi:hypothetical protein